MSSVTQDSDLTAKARIREAAIAAFVRDGVQKANVRAIAAAAGVSVGLVFHHFGNKDGLRTTCDEHVLQVLTARARSAGSPDLLGEYLSDPGEYRLLVQYMARAVQDDVPAAGTFVERLVAESEAIFRAGAADGTMRPSSDPRALGVLTVLISLAVLTMPRPLARALGHEDFGPEVLRRITVPTLELFTRGLYTDDTVLQAAKAAWADAERTEP
ncbi:TetR/AcrR family transcriptional regulator [Pseudonocardia adelaidensis]|uniref:Transcriptional regulator RaaS n=1 Tax=Pseudonocardia adelaidensis TaxID=648754 RepID=A0ABP9PBP9_9PSEU